MKTKQLLLVAALAILFIQCSTEVVLQFNAKLKLNVSDINNNPLDNVKVIKDRYYEGVLINQNQEDYTNSAGELLYVFDEQNAQTRYHKENPIEYTMEENLIVSEHKYLLKFEKDGFAIKDTVIILNHNDNIELKIKLTKSIH